MHVHIRYCATITRPAGAPYTLRRLSKVDMCQQLRGEVLVEYYELGPEVRGNPGQARAVLYGLCLEVRVGQDGGDRSEHDGPHEGGHEVDPLRKDEDDGVAGSESMLLQQAGLRTGAIHEFPESDGQLLIASG